MDDLTNTKMSSNLVRRFSLVALGLVVALITLVLLFQNDQSAMSLPEKESKTAQEQIEWYTGKQEHEWFGPYRLLPQGSVRFATNTTHARPPTSGLPVGQASVTAETYEKYPGQCVKYARANTFSPGFTLMNDRYLYYVGNVASNELEDWGVNRDYFDNWKVVVDCKKQENTYWEGLYSVALNQIVYFEQSTPPNPFRFGSWYFFHSVRDAHMNQSASTTVFLVGDCRRGGVRSCFYDTVFVLDEISTRTSSPNFVSVLSLYDLLSNDTEHGQTIDAILLDKGIVAAYGPTIWFLEYSSLEPRELIRIKNNESFFISREASYYSSLKKLDGNTFEYWVIDGDNNNVLEGPKTFTLEF